MAVRDQSDIGAYVVRTWARQLPAGSRVLDLGCGTGVPISRVLIAAGHRVYGVDAAKSMVAEFARRFPQSQVACEPVECSRFFGERFEGAVAVGLVFLLPEPAQPPEQPGKGQ